MIQDPLNSPDQATEVIFCEAGQGIVELNIKAPLVGMMSTINLR